MFPAKEKERLGISGNDYFIANLYWKYSLYIKVRFTFFLAKMQLYFQSFDYLQWAFLTSLLLKTSHSNFSEIYINTPVLQIQINVSL
jgi:hypothetical protein